MVSKTRFTDLGYEQQGRGNWRFVDLCDGGHAAIGPSYPTKAELLADAPRFYAERWNPEAVATDIPAWRSYVRVSPTIAETVAAALNDDGQCFTSDDGRTLDDLVSDYPHDVAWRDGWHTGDVRRIDFRDGSCLTVAGDAWDIGFPACWCWQGAGHTDDCAQRD